MSEAAMQAQPRPAETHPALRLWPGLLAVAVLWIARIWVSVGDFSPTKFLVGLLITPFVVLTAVILWWLFASRLAWFDRLLIVGVAVVATIVTIIVSGKNFPAFTLMLFAFPPVVTLWVGWLLATPMLHWPIRRAGLLAIFLASAIICSMLRVEGMDGGFAPQFSWRTTPTAEQQMLTALKSGSTQKNDSKPNAEAEAVSLSEQPGDWPGFRGPQRDGKYTGPAINSDWKLHPPKELWRHRIGPGWSSFAVIGNRAYTQEQRGEDEYVVCYDTADGKEIWSHHDAIRFTEIVAGPGPRATPQFHLGRIYAMGAKGTLNCLSAADGKLMWSNDIVKDTKAEIPQWGFSSSPLIAEGIVTVFAGGPQGKSLIAHNAETGKVAWTAGEGKLSYCSPHLAKLDGVDQLLNVTEFGMSAYDPATGKMFWDYAWSSENTARVIQPAIVDSQDLLIGTGMGHGTRRLRIKHENEAWNTQEQWHTRDIKPYFNDLVLYNDHLYGFDGKIFMCVSLQDGARKWRARGYDNGQVLLLADQGLLLILSEQGEVALVAAQPDKHSELAKFKAIEGKTWNHPVIAHGKLFVRNAEEVACYALDLLETNTVSQPPNADKQP